jgi:hypothetical protein
MFVIELGYCDIVLRLEWLHTLGLVTMDFKDLYMKFNKEGKKYTLKGITFGSPGIITSHHMEKLLNKGHSFIIA